MNFSEIILAATVFANLLLGLFVVVKNPRSSTTRSLLLLSFFLSLWLVVNQFSVNPTDATSALLLTRGVMAAAVGICVFFFLLVYHFPDRRESLGSKYFYLLIAGGIAVAAVCMSPILFTGVTMVGPHNYKPVPGPGFLFFLPYSLGLVVGGMVILANKYRKATAEIRVQTGFLLSGVILMFALIIVFNLILPLTAGFTKGIAYSPLFTVIFVGITAYAILTHQLFDIKVIIRKTILFTGLLTVLVSIYAIIIIVSTTMFGGQSRFDIRFLGVNVLATILISIGYEPLNRRLQNFADRFLFRKDFEQQKLLREMSHSLNEVLGLDEALEIIMKGLIGIFSLQHAATYVFQPENHKHLAVKRVRQIGYASATKLMLDEKDFISSFFAERESIVLVEILQRELADEDFRLRSDKDGELARRHAIKQAAFNKLTVLNVAIAIPLHIKQQLIGLIILGPKTSGDPFGESDLSLVDLVSTQIISSIERARLYEGDQMKSEFVSIASHELLTPISAMEGYLSMILDEHMGKTDEKARGYLENVYASTKRLSSLVKDMLLASKLEAGQLKINPAKLDLNKLVADTLIQLNKTAKEKKLVLTFAEPKKLIPPVLADPERTAQILTNLIVNSIKYTFAGSVSVNMDFQESDGMVRVDVTDTGVGMPKEQQAHLFEKFYRVYSLDTADIPGTGLGLYITKSLVEKMGGNISVTSEPKVGSTFSFTLPIFRV